MRACDHFKDAISEGEKEVAKLLTMTVTTIEKQKVNLDDQCGRLCFESTTC